MALWASFLALAWGSIFLAKSVEINNFPVVNSVEITEAIPVAGGLSVYLHFTKVRSCEFLGVIWYDNAGHVVPVKFATDVGTRPPSKNEVGPWLVGLDSLEGSTLFAHHRCHPLWTQFTQMYP